MRIGTRGSPLALWQARQVAELVAAAGGPAGEIVVIRTSGDEGRATVNVKRTFVKEIEDALAGGRIDLAVHSAKDLPAELPEGLAIGAVLARADPSDALVLPVGVDGGSLDQLRARLGQGPRIGTSSVRRAAQLRPLFPAATFVPVRGNVETRLRKLDAAECDVLVLATAGLVRLGLETRISARLPVSVCVPAPGQGIVAIEVRSRPGEVPPFVSAVDHADSRTALIAERAVVAALGGHCQMPLGVLAELDGQMIDVTAVVSSLDGQRRIRAEVRANRGGAAAAGERLAAQLLEQGAAALLAM